MELLRRGEAESLNLSGATFCFLDGRRRDGR
jgi:hypothetical protein